jgi:hypothetical protein
MIRYTAEHQNLAEGMQIVINLYYRLKETDKKEWLSEPVVGMIAELAYKVVPTFEYCLCIKSPYYTKLKLFKGASGLIDLSERDLQKFVDAMDAFHDEYKKPNLIMIGGITRVSKTDRHWPKSIYKDSTKLKIKSLVPGSPEDQPGKGHYKGLSDPPDYHEIIQVHLNHSSTFVDKLYYHFHSYKDAISPYAKGGDTFLGLIRYVFAKYSGAFRSFDRVKTCDYEPCKKIFYDKRYGRKKFHDPICKTRSDIASQDPVKRSCREKQNAFIRRKFTPEFEGRHEEIEQPYTVYKYKCEKCNNPGVKSGLCKTLRKNNIEAFKAFEEDKKHPKKRRIEKLFIS